MQRKVLLLFLGFSFLLIGSTFSQSMITGQVTSAEDNNPLIGVNILVKGSGTGTITDIDGNYSISATTEDVLIFSYLGFQDKEVRVGEQTRISVQLSNDAQVLSEVVVSGYGIRTMRRDVTSAISTIDQATLENTPAVSVTELLQGRAAGVNIVSNDGSPGAGISINIRGLASLSAGGSPLIVWCWSNQRGHRDHY